MRTTPLLLLSSIVALPALAQDQAPPLRFFIDGGYSQTNERFNGSGDKVGADIQLSTLRGGISYDFMQIGELGIGADLKFSAANLESEGATSGFSPRDVGVLLHLEAPRYGLRAGYIHDLGPETRVEGTSVKIPNTDQLSAIQVGGNAQTFFSPNLRVFGNVDYFVTLKGEQVELGGVPGVPVEVVTDANTGDIIAGQAGVGFRPMEALEVGARLAYDYQWSSQDNEPVGEKASNFSIIPFVHLNQPGSPFTFYVEGRADREYAPIGYSFSGNNSPMGKTGVVVGLRYALRADQRSM